ncbi:hypothetical protein GCM10028806_58390 [Spirosoma terrae]
MGCVSHEARPESIFWTFHPTPTGVDGGRETRLNKRSADLYTPVFVGLNTCLRDVLPVARNLPTRSEKPLLF